MINYGKCYEGNNKLMSTRTADCNMYLHMVRNPGS